MTEKPEKAYDKNPDLLKMKQDIADRTFNIQVKGWIIQGITTLVGVGIGALLLSTLGPIALIGGGAIGLMAGGSIAEVLTMKDKKKLQIDEEMTGSYMQGKNYWGAGYREEVAEHGYGGQQVAAPRNNLPREAQGPKNQPPAR